MFSKTVSVRIPAKTVPQIVVGRRLQAMSLLDELAALNGTFRDILRVEGLAPA